MKVDQSIVQLQQMEECSKEVSRVGVTKHYAKAPFRWVRELLKKAVAPMRRTAAKAREILRENVGSQFLSLRHL